MCVRRQLYGLLAHRLRSRMGRQKDWVVEMNTMRDARLGSTEAHTLKQLGATPSPATFRNGSIAQRESVSFAKRGSSVQVALDPLKWTGGRNDNEASGLTPLRKVWFEAYLAHLFKVTESVCTFASNEGTMISEWRRSS